jgi:hypothetical protein
MHISSLGPLVSQSDLEEERKKWDKERSDMQEVRRRKSST